MSHHLSPRPTRKIQPTAKLSTENAGSLELTSHRRAVASASSAAAPTQAPLLPVSESTPTGSDVGTSGPSPDPISARTTKHPRAVPPAVGDDQGDNGNTTDVPDDAPAAKKLKTTTSQAIGLQADISIISIDDVDDLEHERLNKTDPTADIKQFFSATPPVPGQEKGRMLCKLCAPWMLRSPTTEGAARAHDGLERLPEHAETPGGSIASRAGSPGARERIRERLGL
ncbi:hypothetical protein EDB92DRAFT_1958745 [Lactarius akahatsu]|uniref:Uncharacterized protein n=1 Tax=Lactarius akahatsu TaxID=416441 RepID=A0AAD4Q735_9AGAM|nr:hypothetical protein EDB92DRAFT_1958745 [Lactarius akahatsu]